MSRADPDQTNPSRVRWPPVWTADPETGLVHRWAPKNRGGPADSTRLGGGADEPQVRGRKPDSAQSRWSWEPDPGALSI